MAPFLVTVNFVHLISVLAFGVFITGNKPNTLSNILVFLLLMFVNFLFLFTRIIFKRTEKKKPPLSHAVPTNEEILERKQLYRKSAASGTKIAAFITIALAIKIIFDHAL